MNAQDVSMDLYNLLTGSSSDAVRRFLEAWHGPATQAPAPVPAGKLPQPVREFMALAKHWPRAISQNELVNDPDYGRDGERRVFYAENQRVYVWATDGQGTDPTVWGRYGPDEPWQAEREPLSRFLIQVVVFEAVIGANAAWVLDRTLEQLQPILAPLRLLPFGPWRWPRDPTWFYAGTDLLAFVNARGPGQEDGPADRFDVWVAGMTEASIAYLKGIDEVEFPTGIG